MTKPMSVAELRAVLERLHELYSLAGSKGAADDFRRLISTLNGHDGATVDEFVEETRQLLGLGESAVAPKRKPAISAYDPVVVERYAPRLLKAGTSQKDFDSVLAQMKSDPKVGFSELSRIANRYLNEPSGGSFEFEFQSAQEAYRDIRRMFVERLQNENKHSAIKRLTG